MNNNSYKSSKNKSGDNVTSMTSTLPSRKIDINNIGRNSVRAVKNYLKVKTVREMVDMTIALGQEQTGLRMPKDEKAKEKKVLKYWASEINKDIDYNREQKKERDRIERAKQTAENKNIKKIVTKLNNLKPNEKLTIDVKNNQFGYKLMQEIKKKNKRFLMKSNDLTITLNPDNLNRYSDIFKDDSYFVNGEPTIDSFIQQAQEAVNNGSITFIAVGEGGQISGSFFPYKHTLVGLNLTELQIYSIEDSLNVEEHSCFIHSLIAYGLDEEVINQICYITQKREMPQKLIKEIAEQFNLYITVRSITSNGHLRHYGDKTLPQIQLGLIENHYFLIKKMDITRYAIVNYNDIKHIKNFNTIKGKRNNGLYTKDKSMFISSYDVVKILLENKKTHLTSVAQEELYASHFYNKTDEIKNLSIPKECVKENIFMTKKNKFDINSEKQKELPYVNVFFDYETIPQGEKHIEYLCRAECFPDKVFIGFGCGKDMLYALHKKYPKNNIRLIAHNAGYDLRFIMKHLNRISLIERGKMLLRGNAVFNINKGKKIYIQIQDSYAIVPAPLRKFGNMFKINIEKEIMPYNLYTSENVKKQFIDLNECIESCKVQYKNMNIGSDIDEVKQREFINTFLFNCKKWDCINNNIVDIIKYSSIYCKMDCEVLAKGYNTFRKWIQEICDLDIDDYVSLPSIANAYLMKEGVYDGVYSVSCVVREFINKAMVGGRTMCANNKKNHIKINVDDFDAVSLYASAMERLGGYLIGKPKLLGTTDFNIISKYDGYFVEIEILDVPKKFPFPLMSFIDSDKKCRNWTNDMVGKKIVVDKIQLEDLIEFHEINFKIIRGYYYDEGRNNKLKEVITYLFKQRIEAKKKKNPIEAVFKLLMNSAYGKTLLKPIEDETKYISSYGDENKTYENYICKHYNSIKEIIELPNGHDYKIKQYKTIDKHFNNVSCGVEVLSMSKRIMNEVMCLAEDEKLNIYYQDTDSMHINTEQVKILAEKYKVKYDRDLIGKGMGQFHTDFDSEKIKGDIWAKESIFLGKKCYLDVLTGNDGNIDYHIRMKGVSEDSIKDYAYKNNKTILDVYTDLYNGEEITFDLCCEGSKVNFEFKKNMEIVSRDKFERKIKFE